MLENLTILNRIRMHDKSLFTRVLTLFFLAFLSFNLSAEPNLDEGKALFKGNCATCHSKNMKAKMTGPALGGVQERWEDREQLLYDWIRNSQVVIASGDAYANKLYNEYNGSVMTAFPNLTDPQIESILAYVDAVYTGAIGGAPVPDPNTPTTGEGEKGNNNFLFITLFLILGLLAVVLSRIISNLSHMQKVKEGDNTATRRTLADILTSKGLVGAVLFGLIVLGGFTTVNNAINLGRQQGYAPDQPIKFSHVTHAGVNKIDCQYCHDGARRSKHSVIPAANTCMNCHTAIKYGSEYGTEELTKIYASVGYDPNEDKYFEGKTEEEMEVIYKKWIKDQFIEQKGAADARFTSNPALLKQEAEKAMNAQWENLVSSLTNEDKPEIQGGIEWTKIHNLPDHVYFNHAQHVTVGKVECQQCHGAVEEMEVVQQAAPLSMGWCVNCHRETEVQFADNDYYQSYEKYHSELQAGTRKKVTVEDIGGLECQKCHY